jgi:hypothetical protein
MNKPQATIQANLGTSELAVLIKNHGFIPLWDRSEPNDKATQESWINRSQIIVNELCAELGVQTRIPKKGELPFEFIKLTERLFHVYEQEPKKWKNRLYPSRLIGIIEKAREKFDIANVDVFVTKQNPIHESDSFFLFKILQKWFEEEQEIRLQSKPIPDTINLRKDVDDLSDYYYKQIQALDPTQVILISRKGGTGAMINALNQQVALSSIDRKIILIDPELVVDKVLSGEPSPCKLTSYWKYIRIQKYEAIGQLLERWDFDGAKVILEEWKRYLDELISLNVIDREISKSKSLLDKNLKILDLTCAYFNLDSSGTISGKVNKKRANLGIFNYFQYTDYARLLNLHAQCSIYWKINQVANFLFRLASFYEEVLHYLIENLDGIKYFDKENHLNDWYLKPNLKKQKEQLWLKFKELETKIYPDSKIADWDDNYKKLKLSGRYSKRNFLEALVNLTGKPKKIEIWQEINDNFNKLDYWISLRNKVTHSAEGASKAGMVNLFQKDRSSKDEKALIACKRDEILPVINSIKQKVQELVKDNSKFDSNYFIYDEVRKQVIEDLMNN